MKINKIFGVKSITNLIYGLLLMIPFVSILSRVIYVQSQGGYHTQEVNIEYKYQSNEVNTVDDLTIGNIYNFNYNGDVTNLTNNFIEFKIISGVINLTHYVSYTTDIDLSINIINGTEIILYKAQNSLVLNYPNFDYLFEISVEDVKFYTTNLIIQLKQYDQIIDLTAFSYTNYNEIENVEVIDEGVGDNVFEYSLHTFTQDNNLGNVDFFSWFTNMFLNQDNPHNAIYLNFANWYMNYTLLVSTGYLLFLALIWFINWVRKLLEKSSYHDFGGF